MPRKSKAEGTLTKAPKAKRTKAPIAKSAEAPAPTAPLPPPTKDQKLEVARAAHAQVLKKHKAPVIVPDTIWLIEPKGQHTNEVLSKTVNVTEEGLIRCSDGKDHFLYRMSGYSAVTVFRRSMGKHLIFNVFRRRGMHRPEEIKNWFKGEHTEPERKPQMLAKAA